MGAQAAARSRCRRGTVAARLRPQPPPPLSVDEWTKHCLLTKTNFRWLMGVGRVVFRIGPWVGLGYEGRTDVLDKVMSVVSMILGESLECTLRLRMHLRFVSKCL